jgi:RNA polymerase primary sigma factor
MFSLLTSSSLDEYLRDIRSVPACTVEQEHLWIRQILRARRERVEAFPRAHILEYGVRARQALIEAKLPLVVSVAKQYTRRCVHFHLEDLIQEGVIGLIHAVDRYEEMGKTFNTCALHFIHKAVLAAIYRRDRAVTVPERVLSVFHRLRHVQERFEASGDGWDLLDLQREMQLDRSEVCRLLEIQETRTGVSLDQPVREDGDACLADLLQAPTGGLAGGSVQDGPQVESLSEWLACLSERERAVMQLRYGLGQEDGHGHTYKEIGETLGIRASSAQSLERMASEKLRWFGTRGICYTTDQVMVRLGVSRSQVQRWDRQGRLQRQAVSFSRLPYYAKAEVEALAVQLEQQQRTRMQQCCVA